jgi:hypothetical protein
MLISIITVDCKSNYNLNWNDRYFYFVDSVSTNFIIFSLNFIRFQGVIFETIVKISSPNKLLVKKPSKIGCYCVIWQNWLFQEKKFLEKIITKCISIQQGVDVTSWRWYSAPQPLTKDILKRTFHILNEKLRHNNISF